MGLVSGLRVGKISIDNWYKLMTGRHFCLIAVVGLCTADFCAHGGTCVSGNFTGARCECTEDYEGATCNNRISESHR